MAEQINTLGHIKMGGKLSENKLSCSYFKRPIRQRQLGFDFHVVHCCGFNSLCCKSPTVLGSKMQFKCGVFYVPLVVKGGELTLLSKPPLSLLFTVCLLAHNLFQPSLVSKSP